MPVIISTQNNKIHFQDRKVISIGSSPNDDFWVDGHDLQMFLEFDANLQKYILHNNNVNAEPYFKGKPFQSLEINNIIRLLYSNSEDFINIEVVKDVDNFVSSEDEKLQECDCTDCSDYESFQDDTKNKLNKHLENINLKRISIVKEISHKINDLKKKISQNIKCSIFTHVALFLAALVCAFAVSNYIMGLSISESANYLHLPTNIKIWLLYTFLTMGILLILKQGFYGYFYYELTGGKFKITKNIQCLLILLSSLILTGIYAFNLIYYLDYAKSISFPFFISTFFIGIAYVLAVSSGYFKANGCVLTENLYKYEYRVDFEQVISEYQKWINCFVNTLSEGKNKYIRDKLFSLRIKEFFEMLIGILTAPFLAYGVSNTLAMCFPEAAGWIRISGLRFSPVFLVLSTALIIFAFSLLSFCFLTMNKINNSEVIKYDGFSRYLIHCAEIFGLTATVKIQKEMKTACFIALTIIFIEITMNISYFSNEIGHDFSGLFLSAVSAFVPTALLIAETFLLGRTKFEIYALEEIISKADKEC